MLTEQTQSQCRHLDRITVKGSILPLDIYTVDIYLPNLEKFGTNVDIFDTSMLN